MNTFLALKCDCCGDKLRYDEKKKKYVCDSCGTEFERVYETSPNDFEITAGVLVKYKGESPVVRIPKGVLIIGDNCFSGMELIESIALPDGIIKIGENAFSGCSRLRSVFFAETVESIGNCAFKDSGLVEAVLPGSLKEIGKDAFMGCTSLQKVILPDKNIRYERTFKQCESLKEVTCNLKYFCISFRSSNEARKNGDSRPTLFDAFQATPYFGSLFLKQLNNECVICGSPIGKRGVCTGCGTKHVDLDRGCYIATSVYGSYDCPQVWTLRRYRDDILAGTAFGRAFISVYYAVSPKLVELFGNKEWFTGFWKKVLDRKVKKLNEKGVENAPYKDC